MSLNVQQYFRSCDRKLEMLQQHGKNLLYKLVRREQLIQAVPSNWNLRCN